MNLFTKVPLGAKRSTCLPLRSATRRRPLDIASADGISSIAFGLSCAGIRTGVTSPRLDDERVLPRQDQTPALVEKECRRLFGRDRAHQLSP